MAFIKGKSGNPGGIKQNKVDSPEKMREELHAFLVSQLPAIKKDFKMLKSRDRVLMFERLARYVLTGPELDLSRFSEKDLDILITRLKSKLNETTT